MKRREFITLLGATAAVASPLAARAQQTERTRRIGVLMGFAHNDPEAQAQIAALQQELQKLGWEDGRNVRIDVRFPAADVGNAHSMLKELMSLAPDVLVCNTNLVTAIAQAEVKTIPIVFVYVGEPVLSGFVGNDRRPNSNLTGFANWDSPAMSGKWLELLNEVAPRIERVGFVMHPETPAHVRFFKFGEALAPALKLTFVPLGVHDEAEIERTLTAFAAGGNGGVIVTPHAVTLANRDFIVALAARLRLPALYPLALYPKSGGLISYGPDPVSQIRQGAGYVDRLLRGAKPADLPVQYPTKYQLVVNLKTARALGLAVPQAVLARADEVIE